MVYIIINVESVFFLGTISSIKRGWKIIFYVEFSMGGGILLNALTNFKNGEVILKIRFLLFRVGDEIIPGRLIFQW